MIDKVSQEMYKKDRSKNNALTCILDGPVSNFGRGNGYFDRDFEFLIAGSVEILIFWDVTNWPRVDWLVSFETPCCFILFTPWSRVLEKVTDYQVVKKFRAFYGNRRFITAFTSARHLSLSWTRSIQSITSRLTSWISVLLLSSHLRLGLPSGRFPHQTPVYASPLPHTRYMPRPYNSSRFYHPNNIGWGVQIIQLLIMQFPPLPCYLVPRRSLNYIILPLTASTSLRFTLLYFRKSVAVPQPFEEKWSVTALSSLYI